MQKRKILITAGIAALMLSGGTAAYAATASIPGLGGVIAGCYVKSGGVLRVIDSSVTTCKSNETSLDWNQTGADFGMVDFSGGSCSLGQVSGPDAAGMAAEPTSDGCLIVFNDLNSASSTLIPLATPYEGSDASVIVTLGSAGGHPDISIGNEGDSGQYDFVAFLEGES